jgi:predicted nucleic acid-binding protein
MILLDTNLLARFTDSKHPHCAASRRAISVLLTRGEQLIIVPQNLYEFWAVATRKAGPPPAGQNGLGMSCGQASLWLNYFQRRFMLMADRADLPALWHGIVKALGITGLKSHDARLVAAMQSHGIQQILTFNAADFKVHAITIIDPSSVR